MGLDTATASVILRMYESRKNRKGEYPVNLRITYKRDSKYYTVKGQSATKEEFEAVMNPKSQGVRAKLRKKFEAIESRAKAVIDELPEFTFEAFEKEYLNKKPKNATIQDYFNDKIESLEASGKYGTATPYRNTLKALTKFDNNLSFQKITPKYLKRFEDWFVIEGKRVQKGSEKKGGSYTTVAIYMRHLRHIVNLAIDDKVINSYPFGNGKGKYEIPVSKNTKKALTIDEVGLLMNYQTNNVQELVSVKYWLFSYLCNGMNFTDILHLKYKNIEQDNVLRFYRQKTKDTTKVKSKIEVVLLPEAIQIINDLGSPNREPDNYVFPILKKGQTAEQKTKLVAQHISTTNKYLKRAAKTLGITESISTYYARHSYATITRNSGASTEFIAEQLGHQNTSVTKAYLDSFKTDTKREFQNKLIPQK